MAATYQVQGYEAYVREVDEPLTEKFWQYLTIYALSAANTQTAYDFGSYVAGSLGTFWTAAIADTTAITVNVNGVPTATTQGALATSALGLLQFIGQITGANLQPVAGNALLTYQQVLSGASGKQYVLTVANNAPSIAFASTNAPTTVSAFTFVWDLPAGNHGIKSPITYF